MFVGVDVECGEIEPPQLAGRLQGLEACENVQTARARAGVSKHCQGVRNLLEGVERLSRRHFLDHDTIRADQENRVRLPRCLGVVALVDHVPMGIHLKEVEFRKEFERDR